MQSLSYVGCILVALLTLINIVGCQNNVDQSDLIVIDAGSQHYRPDSVATEDLLRPVRFSLQVYSGGSGNLLPENVDIQLSPLLEQFADWNEISKIIITGHTDAEGSRHSNFIFSVKRAQAIADMLIAHGVPSAVVEVEGRGENSPIADNTSIDGKQLNRRVEIYAEGLDQFANPVLAKNRY